MNAGLIQIQSMANVLDSLGVALCLYDGNDRAVMWNASFLKFFPEHDGFIHVGEPYAENLRRFYAGRLGPDETALAEEYVRAGIDRHQTQQAPFSFQHRGRWLLVSSAPLPGVGRVRIWRPTEDTSPAQLKDTHLFEHMADGIMVVDADGLISWVNDRFMLQYGLAGKGPVVGERFESVYARSWEGHAAGNAEAYAQGRAALPDHMAFSGAPFQLPLPGDRWLRIVAQRSSSGVTYFAHVDITLLERRRRELTEKTLQLETTLRSISQGIFMMNAAGNLTIYNEQFRDLLDLPESLLATRPTLPEITGFQLARGDFGEGQRLVEPHARSYVSAAGQEKIPGSYLRKTKDGRVMEVKSQSLPDGGLVRTFTDVTDYVHVKDELQRLNDELEERVARRTEELQAANKELEAFSYSIAHDLRQPLSSIDGFSTLLAALVPADAGGRAAHYATRMRAGIRQMSALTDGLLALAQLARARLQWKAFDVGDAALRTVHELREGEPGRKVAVDVAPGLVVLGEPVLLRQVVENLVGNAWKFTARTQGARIEVGCTSGDAGEAVFYVRDNGAGFDMTYVNKLFGAFQRLHSPGEFSGTGIGLATVQRIIARHGGRVWAEGREGEGATFFFTIGMPPPEPATSGN